MRHTPTFAYADARLTRCRRRDLTLKGLLATLALGWLIAPAFAATGTASFTVAVAVQAACKVTLIPLAFGSYTGVQKDATGTVTVTCTNSTPYNVNLNCGANWAGGSVYVCSMVGPGGAKVTYSMYRDTTRSLNWGNTAGHDGIGGTGNGSPRVLTIYGRMGGAQYVQQGAYSDTVIATVAY
jgi:spore coat protein U-like protein